ncbi:acyl carrier protein [Maridesulfovibrio sp.]|uniref:acyl carrier protein n=1 Tax=Maridesulfovibrio sp. TaxID=2795000 RepID=UPI002A18D878|nr:acyl carrier protein [Maridesulfovibrio sp.]
MRPTKTEIIEQVKQVTAQVMGLNSLKLKEEFHYIADLGTDSLSMLQIKLELEDLYDIDIPDEHITKISSIGSTGDYLLERLSEES